MSLTRCQAGVAVAAIAALCILLTWAYARSLGEAPDEMSHLHMVAHHAHTLRLSTWEDWRYGFHRAHPYHLFSPIPYFAHVPFHWLSDLLPDPSRVRSAR